MEQKDNSIVKITTLHYKEYTIMKQTRSLMIYGSEYDNINFYETKLNIFKDFLKLGESLFNTIEKIELSDEITIFIDNDNLNSDKLKNEFHNFFPTEFFNNILNLTINNTRATNYLIKWIKKYGLPNIDDSIYYDINQFENNPNDNELRYINDIKKEIRCDILPLVNSSILFYLIFNLQNCIAQVKTKFLKKYISPFQYLCEQYEEYCYYDIEETYEYDAAYGLIINDYIKKLIQILNYYLYDSICSRNVSEILYPDITLLDTEKKHNAELPNLFPIDYLVRSPILLTFEYLCQILPLKNFNSTIYHCDNCNEIMNNDEELCISCKLSLGNKFLSFHTNKINKYTHDELEKIKNTSLEFLTKYQKSILNSIEYKTLLGQEIKSVEKKGITSTPTIIQLYRDSRDQTLHNKKRKK